MTRGPDDGDDTRNINIPEKEGRWDIVVPEILIDKINQPLNIRKVNIGTEEQLKFVNIGDYWDEEIKVKIIDLLHEF